MRILVTGGAGFIGSHVADAFLAAGHEVGVVDDLSSGSKANLDPRVRFWPADIRDLALDTILAEFRPEIVSHHAAQMSVGVSVREPKRDADINILGTLNLLEAAVRHGVRRVCFASTGGAMYGDGAAPPTPEAAAPEPVSPYGVAKLAVERYLHAFRAMHGLEAVALRYANVYGPRQNPHGEAGVVAIFCRAIVAGHPFTINGDGGQTRDYTYVGDVVAAVLRAAALPVADRVPILNVGTGIETSVTDLVTTLQAIVGRPLPFRHGPAKPGEQRRSALDAALAQRVLGWQPGVDVRAGLERTLAWFRQCAGSSGEG
ncbi:MAG: NAD-dependent epimerase/dehydratase family protein [Zetaproteobacteria bacterium]|nr:MAG: NAD-dependent epimerase/dehydratase family protein [Zetaproteobacteria bacterium]